MSPAEAAGALIRNGHDTPYAGMDDPTEAGPDYRWWWNGAGNLCGAWWRGSTTIYGAFTLKNALDYDGDDWPVHQPLAAGAPIPGIHWYSGCEPDRPRVNPSTGVCEGCGETACPVCGREDCGDHA